MPGDRRSIRLRYYDYSQLGGYYVTICVKGRKNIFGDVINGKMILNDMGRIAEFTWSDLSRHNKNIVLDEFIVMPNHVHGIIVIVGAGSKPALNGTDAPTRNNHGIMTNNNRAGLEPAPTRGLSEIVRQFKTFSAKRINIINNTCGVRLWQRNFYEHVIRDDLDLIKIRGYIANNPIDWNDDKYHINH